MCNGVAKVTDYEMNGHLQGLGILHQEHEVHITTASCVISHQGVWELSEHYSGPSIIW